MTRHKTQTGGWLGRLRLMGESLLDLAQTRIELFAVELQEEKLRLLNFLVWFVVALTFGMAAMLLGLGTLAVWIWNLAGYLGLAITKNCTSTRRRRFYFV